MESIVSLKSAYNIKILFTFDNTHGFYQMMLAHLQYHYEPKHIIWILDRRPASHQQLRELNMMDMHVSPVNIILLHIKCGRVCVTILSVFHSFILHPMTNLFARPFRCKTTCLLCTYSGKGKFINSSCTECTDQNVFDLRCYRMLPDGEFHINLVYTHLAKKHLNDTSMTRQNICLFLCRNIAWFNFKYEHLS